MEHVATRQHEPERAAGRPLEIEQALGERSGYE